MATSSRQIFVKSPHPKTILTFFVHTTTSSFFRPVSPVWSLPLFLISLPSTKSHENHRPQRFDAAQEKGQLCRTQCRTRQGEIENTGRCIESLSREQVQAGSGLRGYHQHGSVPEDYDGTIEIDYPGNFLSGFAGFP